MTRTRGPRSPLGPGNFCKIRAYPNLPKYFTPFWWDGLNGNAKILRGKMPSNYCPENILCGVIEDSLNRLIFTYHKFIF